MTGKKVVLHVVTGLILLVGMLGPITLVLLKIQALRANPCIVTVMPLGDSITKGAAGSSDNTGYRRSLYLQLTGAGYDVDFVGSQTGGTPTDFDNDHEGRSGWHAIGGCGEGIGPNVYDWLSATPADIVLLHVGTNDIWAGQDAVSLASEVDRILDEIDRWETDNGKNVWVVLARIINRSDPNDVYGRETTAFNAEIQSLAETRIANGDRMMVVDMENALIYPDDLTDEVHPNDAGYGKMAEVWRTALINFLPTWCSSDFDAVEVRAKALRKLAELLG